MNTVSGIRIVIYASIKLALILALSPRKRAGRESTFPSVLFVFIFPTTHHTVWWILTFFALHPESGSQALLPLCCALKPSLSNWGALAALLTSRTRSDLLGPKTSGHLTKPWRLMVSIISSPFQENNCQEPTAPGGSSQGVCRHQGSPWLTRPSLLLGKRCLFFWSS